jgi:hypothetical protein
VSPKNPLIYKSKSSCTAIEMHTAMQINAALLERGHSYNVIAKIGRFQ